MVNTIGVLCPVCAPSAQQSPCETGRTPLTGLTGKRDDVGAPYKEVAQRLIKGFGGGNLVFALLKDLVTHTDRDMRMFCFEALDLELRRVDANITCDNPIFEAGRDYRQSIDNARFAHLHARIYRFLSHDFCELPYHWLVLVGYRLAVERGFQTGGFGALAILACERLGLSRCEVDLWNESLFFQHYKDTELRQEWDYPGVWFRAL